ncbi:expression site-associated 1 (ESAG 1) protein [Trypanosoma brucei equiperdum]|uniref:Expression site-associated 1 (ESAG 1) protein n=1 Tax=Trypanosoma brucei equiperdum TaxID=630700 RepID=A0A3L6LCC1_9TRYP|nr:expression site-associated 1 (ESAG 1) protein [Trypanosoma brucei equiperdum]
MRDAVVELATLLYFVIRIDGREVFDHRCKTVDDHFKNNLRESVCYLKCISDALNKLYTDGEQKLLVNEGVHANASRILDDMESKTGESTTYLSIISGVMESKHDKLEKLISYGNTMGNLVAKAGGLFAEVNESVRAVRNTLPTALLTANKYYTAIAEITRTVWDDVKALPADDNPKCENRDFQRVEEFQVRCGAHTCPLSDGVNESALQKYKGHCLDVNVASGSVSECFNLPRNKLYKSGVVNDSREALDWHDHRDDATFFQLEISLRSIFAPLIIPFDAGKPPSILLTVMSNITSLYSRFNEVHSNFTSLLLDINVTDNADNTNSNSNK